MDRLEIVSEAHRIKKATRREAFHIIRKGIQADGTLTERDFVELYSFFLSGPLKSSIKEDNFSWVSQVVADNNPKFDLKFIKVEDGIAYATDGYRLLYAHVCMDDGYYDIAKCKVEDKKFPVIKQLIDNTNKTVTNLFDNHDFQVVEEIVRNGKVTHCYNVNGVYVDTRFMSEAMQCDGKLFIRSNNEEDKVRVDCVEQGRFSIIMGCRR